MAQAQLDLNVVLTHGTVVEQPISLGLDQLLGRIPRDHELVVVSDRMSIATLIKNQRQLDVFGMGDMLYSVPTRVLSSR